MDRPARDAGRPARFRADRGALVRHIADSLIKSQQSLKIHPALEALAPKHLRDGGALVLDDTGGIALADRVFQLHEVQDRARIRAGDGDTVLTSTHTSADFEAYCRDQLQLGAPHWLHCHPPTRQRGLASTCWLEKDLRQELIERVRDGRIRYLHPHMGNYASWTLAMLLSRAAKRPLLVIGPHPGLCAAVNNKVWFTRVTNSLLGSTHTPVSRPASSFSGLACLAKQLGREGSRLVVKIPDSAGGEGNLVFNSKEFRKQRLGTVRKILRQRLEPTGWKGATPLLVSCWESDVLSTPSIQAWIPPLADGAPVVEGIFEQMIHGDNGIFEGCHPAHLPQHLGRSMLQDSLALCELYQLLGYVGRCSFDTIIVGKTSSRSRAEFIECNGRWGGTSLPMTLSNRLFGNTHRRPFASRSLRVPGLERVCFEEIRRQFKKHLYNARTGRGWLVIFSSGYLSSGGTVDVLCLGKSQVHANTLARETAPGLLQRLVRQERRLPAKRPTTSLTLMHPASAHN